MKGTEESQSVDAYYEPDMICPAPPYYKEGALVLAFLTRSQRRLGYITAGLSYGAKSLNDREIEVYSERIRELIEIEKQSDPKARRRQLVEWLVRCAEDPVTRWEGAYDLRDSREMKIFEIEMENERKKAPGDRGGAVGVDEMEERKEEVVDFTSLLTKKQKRRLTAALYRASSLSNGGIELIELVELWGDNNLVPFMWSYLKASRKDSPWETRDLMSKLATLLKNQEALELTEKFNSVIYPNPEREAQKERENNAILQRFIEAIERSGAPRTVEINKEPEKTGASRVQQSAKGGNWFEDKVLCVSSYVGERHLWMALKP